MAGLTALADRTHITIMRVKIIPKLSLSGEFATSFECNNHRIVSGNVASEISFFSDSGKLLQRENVVLDGAKYLEWADTPAASNDDLFLTIAHAEKFELEEAPPPPPPGPVEPPEPPTPEEVEAKKQADIASISAQIDELQAQLDELQK